MELLQQTAAPDQIDPAQFDAIYFTGGHAVMWDFPDSTGLQRITRAIWEGGHRLGRVPRLSWAAEHHPVRWNAAGRGSSADRVFLA
ncbi:type 1 glutamine amidotransferase family protein [Paracoccus fistulariae]